MKDGTECKGDKQDETPKLLSTSQNTCKNTKHHVSYLTKSSSISHSDRGYVIMIWFHNGWYNIIFISTYLYVYP